MRSVFLVPGIRFVSRSVVTGFRVTAGSVVLVKLLGAIRPFEFVAFAGNTGEGDGQDEQGKKFHRGAS